MGPGSKFDPVMDDAMGRRTAKSSIVADTRHQKPRLYGRILTRTARGIGLPVKEDDMNTPRYSAFYTRLREAYRREYEKPSIIIYGQKKAFNWWDKASFTGLDPRSVLFFMLLPPLWAFSSFLGLFVTANFINLLLQMDRGVVRQRHTIKRGDVVEFRTITMANRRLGRIDQILSHDLGFSKSFKLSICSPFYLLLYSIKKTNLYMLPDDTRIFIQMIPIVDTGEVDDLTKFRIYKHDFGSNVLLIGLPAIQSTGKYRYMVPVTLQDRDQRSFRLSPPNSHSLADTLLLHIDWDIQFA